MAESCAERSEAAGEPLAGSAAHAEQWLFIEEPGPWDPKTLPSPGLDSLRDALRSWLGPGRRLQLLRRPQRSAGTREVWLAKKTGLLRGTLSDAALRDALTANALEDALSPDDALRFAVCTHGKRDRCCAVRGQALFQKLAALAPEATWQTSHLGGHRFAATMVLLPAGYALGRVPASEAAAIQSAADGGRLHDVARVRGPIFVPGPAQAAELRARKDHGLDAFGDVDVSLAGTRATVTMPQGSVSLEVRETRLDATRPKSCGDKDKPIDAFVAELPAPRRD